MPHIKTSEFRKFLTAGEAEELVVGRSSRELAILFKVVDRAIADSYDWIAREGWRGESRDLLERAIRLRVLTQLRDLPDTLNQTQE